MMEPYTTPLHFCEFPKEASVLLDAGADINALDAGGNPLLVNLFEPPPQGSMKLFRYLIYRGADLSLVPIDQIVTILMQRRGEDNHGFQWKAILEAVQNAGGLRRYMRAPRVALVRLRSLCARGCATTSPLREPILFRLFAPKPPASSTTKTARFASSPIRQPLPNGVFWHIISFWRTTRDEEFDVDDMLADDGSDDEEDY